MVQEILAKELEKMSLDQHEKVLFDVHGIADVPDEDPKLVQSQLEQLEELLNSSQIPDNEAYQEVARLNPEYAAEYRRTFLRGEKYNVRLAAEKLAQHFHVIKLTREGTFSEFLGIKFDRNLEDKSVTMTQTGLINKIIETAGMVDCNPNWTPTSTTPLAIDPEGEPMDEDWNYRSIVGMLLYLTTNTRPDLAFAVSQVGRFCHAPKQSHATALKTIVRYLRRTADKGMTVKPTEILSLDCYVDASFANSYGVDPPDNPVSVKSRTGIIIFLAGCPLIWKSCLQQSIALSTFHAEYSALSHCMRILIPLREMLIETVSALSLPDPLVSSIHTTVHEDNASALLLANSQHLNNRNKYLSVKMHHFWTHVKPGIIRVVKCATRDMLGDPFTKPLARELFERLRKLIMGW